MALWNGCCFVTHCLHLTTYISLVRDHVILEVLVFEKSNTDRSVYAWILHSVFFPVSFGCLVWFCLVFVVFFSLIWFAMLYMCAFQLYKSRVAVLGKTLLLTVLAFCLLAVALQIFCIRGNEQIVTALEKHRLAFVQRRKRGERPAPACNGEKGRSPETVIERGRERERERVGGEEWGTKLAVNAKQVNWPLNSGPFAILISVQCLKGSAFCVCLVSLWRGGVMYQSDFAPDLVFDSPFKREQSGLVDDRFVKTLITWRWPKA